MKIIEVVPYTPKWKFEFQKLRDNIYPLIKNYIEEIIHIGSTSIQDLAAKPIIDMVIVGPESNFSKVMAKLKPLGYYHNGDQGIKGREVIKIQDNKANLYYKHHLYYCDPNSMELIRYRAFLMYLNKYPNIRQKYSTIKINAAKKCNNDIKAYMDYKGEFIVNHLAKAMTEYGKLPRNLITQCSLCHNKAIEEIYIVEYIGNGGKKEYFKNKCELKHIWISDV